MIAAPLYPFVFGPAAAARPAVIASATIAPPLPLLLLFRRVDPKRRGPRR